MNNTILVRGGGESEFRGSAAVPVKLDELTENLNDFLTQIGNTIEKSPAKLGAFVFNEITVNAEITAGGKFVLLGIGGEASAKGGITFKFTRQNN